MPVPTPDSYWVVAGKFLAGEYPRNYDDETSRDKLGAFLDAGIRVFVDLTTERDPLKPYAAMMREIAEARGLEVDHCRFPIPDLGVPDPDLMREILDRVEQAIADGTPVYVHCFGGIGRTGTVVGCWLAEHGCSGADAVDRIAEMRAGTPDEQIVSPETAEQREMVTTWRASAE